jgi:hypothetical protein
LGKLGGISLTFRLNNLYVPLPQNHYHSARHGQRNHSGRKINAQANQ